MKTFNHLWIFDYLEETFGKTFIISSKDSLLDTFMGLEEQGACDIRLMDCPDPKCFPKMIFEDINPIVVQMTGGLVWVDKVSLYSDRSYGSPPVNEYSNPKGGC